ncbi:hypothetical protein AAHE18_02G193700 [Arachis hypogaea]|nr:uncharacterized protein DS421_12g384780 [Arachis hypogaea]
MSKLGVLHVIIIMIIGTIIYSVIAEFDSFISDGEEPWYPSITDHSSLELDVCYKKCDQTYDKFSSLKSNNRWKRCRRMCRELEEKLRESIWEEKHIKKKRKEAIRGRG